MGFFGLFGSNNQCAVCKSEIYDLSTRLQTVQREGIPDVFSKKAFDSATHSPALECKKCGAKICIRCEFSDWKNSPNCPKCGSDLKSAKL
jgi:predicted RNA-binding Zn-ribbon protein involved in translation (DUF1610 family)